MPSKGRAMVGALWLPVIALCVQEGDNPSDHYLLARLTSHNEGETPRERSLSANVNRTHILIGRTFDISSSDLHSTDLRYDTWVMQTIWGRIANNTTTKPLVG